MRKVAANPFFVLGVSPLSTLGEIEREGAKILAMIAAGVADSTGYYSPLGRQSRTPEAVRTALAELRSPERRLFHEWWVRDSAG